MVWCEWSYRNLKSAARRNCKKVVATDYRREGVYNRTDNPSVCHFAQKEEQRLG